MAGSDAKAKIIEAAFQLFHEDDTLIFKVALNASHGREVL